MSFKRHRSSSTNSSTSSSSIQDTHHKLSRTANTNAHSLLCTLPPTCNHHPTPIANVKDLEAHYAMYHAHVCEQPGCGCVFPDERLLELVSAYPRGNSCMSLIEFYLFVSIRQSAMIRWPLSGKTAVKKQYVLCLHVYLDAQHLLQFACHLSTCPRLFLTPKTRRLHLIQAHAFPKEYFFAVTNKGVGGLLKKWGEGASMIRGEWKERDARSEDDNVDPETDEKMITDDIEEEQQATPVKTTINASRRRNPTSPPTVASSSTSTVNTDTKTEVDDLANSMDSLSLIPSSIRFGRGGRNGGFVTPGGAYRGGADIRGRGRGGFRGRGEIRGAGVGLPRGSGKRGGYGVGSAGKTETDPSMDVDPSNGQVPSLKTRGGSIPMGRGRGAYGRGGVDFNTNANGFGIRGRGRGRARGRGRIIVGVGRS